MQIPTSEEATNTDKQYVYKREGVNHPTLFEIVHPHLTPEGKYNLPEGMYHMNAYGLGELQWAISVCNAAEFGAFLSMNAPSMPDKVAESAIQQVRRLYHYMSQDNKPNEPWQVVWHPAADFVSGFILSSWADEDEAKNEWDRITNLLSRGVLSCLRPLDWDEDAYETLEKDRQLLIITQPPTKWMPGKPSPN